MLNRTQINLARPRLYLGANFTMGGAWLDLATYHADQSCFWFFFCYASEKDYPNVMQVNLSRST